MLLTIIAGARPNFMKIAPLIAAIKKKQQIGVDILFRLIHTGQHYDTALSGTFFKELNIPEPHKNLGVGSGTQAVQTANIMIEFEKELTENPTDLVLVVGDVTSTMACAIVAKKMQTKVVHVEGGIRSFDLSMPEEINRMLTDSITDYFYVTSEVAIANLKKLGHSDKQIVFVGNTMIDTLITNEPNFKKPPIWNALSLEKKKYIILTMHRPANVDEEKTLQSVLDVIVNSSKSIPVIFPTHPRTKAALAKLTFELKDLHIIDPLGYFEFNYLVKNALCVLTDSGGITEETTYMNVPCLTLRENTERPETVFDGSNELVGSDPIAIKEALNSVFEGSWKKGSIPKLWDGKAAERIIDHLVSLQL